MDEILKRLNEIKAEANEALKLDPAERKEKLKALKEEADKLRIDLADVKEESETIASLNDVPEADEDKGGDGDDAGNGDGDSADDGDKGDDDAGDDDAGDGDEEKAGDDNAVALAASAANPVDTDLKAEKHDGQAIALIASGNVGGTNPGDKLDARAMDRIQRHAAHSRPGKGAVKAIFASMACSEGPSLSDRNSPAANSALMASASADHVKPITAAAAFCGPDDIVLDICAAGTDARPVQNLFRTVPVRGKFRYMKTATLTDTATGVGDGTGGVWEEADQIALDVDPAEIATWKPCVDLTCRDETTVTPYAIPACVTMGTWQQLSAPEQIANWLTQMQKQYSRVAETQLLNRIRAQSFVYTAGAGGQGLWTTIQPLLANVASLAAAVNRGTTEGYVIVAPYGTLAALAADETMRGFSQNKGIERIQAELRENYGMTIVEAYETDSTVAASYRTGVTDLGTKVLGGAGTAFTQSDASPDVTPLYVLNPDSFVAGASDVVDAGYYRDGTLVRQNLVRYFWEGMEFLEKQCDHLSFVFELSNCPSGVAPALADAPACNVAL